MNFLDDVDVLVLTYNEELNIERTIDALYPFPHIVVLDSYSTDETANLVAKRSNTRLIQRVFDNHSDQWNFGLTHCGLKRTWVLALDADYVVSESLINEISNLTPAQDVEGFRCSFRYCVFGRRLTATLYPTAVVLFRRECGYYAQFGHTQRVVIAGRVGNLVNKIDHDDRKPLSRWVTSQKAYAVLEAAYLISTPRTELRMSDSIRLLAWPAPFIVFIYTLFAKCCVLDGWPGWFYVLQRTLAEILISLELIELRSGDRRYLK